MLSAFVSEGWLRLQSACWVSESALYCFALAVARLRLAFVRAKIVEDDETAGIKSCADALYSGLACGQSRRDFRRQKGFLKLRPSALRNVQTARCPIVLAPCVTVTRLQAVVIA